MLEQEGYPFKSKEHSAVVGSFQGGNRDGKWIEAYLSKTGRYGCRKELRYQFTDDCKLKISNKCCKRLKEDPLKNYMKTAEKKYAIIGIMASEGGRRSGAKCLIFSNNKKNNKLINFQPMAPLTKSWENWFIQQYNIDICEIYKEPYNFSRTGCKGCPFNHRLSKDLDTLEKFFPNERKQCEAIWKPVYDEYRRLGYRLKKRGEENANDSGAIS